MSIISEAKVSPVGKVNEADIKKLAWNALIFSAPALVVFFVQLQLGVQLKDALLVAALTLYGLLADFFKKLQNK